MQQFPAIYCREWVLALKAFHDVRVGNRNPFLIESRKSHFLIQGQGGRMIKVAGMDPDSLRVHAPCGIDRPVDKITAQAATDKFGHETEIRNFDTGMPSAVDFHIAGGNTTNIKDIDRDLRIMDEGGKGFVVHLPSFVPVPVATDRVVEIAIE